MPCEGTQPAREESCEVKDRLLREYTTATADYSRAVQVLQRRLGVLSKTEYERLREFSETARTKSESARLALDAHVRNHGC